MTKIKDVLYLLEMGNIQFKTKPMELHEMCNKIRLWKINPILLFYVAVVNFCLSENTTSNKLDSVLLELKQKRKTIKDKSTSLFPGLQKLMHTLFSFQNTQAQSQTREPLNLPRESTDQETSEHKADRTHGQYVLLLTDIWGTLLGLNL